MKNKTPFVVPLCLLVAAGLLAGCKHKVIFATETSIGLNVSGVEMPNKVSFSYNRQEAAIVPRKEGAAGDEGHSVYGGLDSDVKFDLPPQYRIKQVFATGEAAQIAASKGTTPLSDPAAAPGGEGKSAATGATARPREKSSGSSGGSERDHALYFATGTTFGLHLSLGEEHAPPNALLGYRRTEATYIPVPDPGREVRSVYADIEISGNVPAPAGDGVTPAAGAPGEPKELEPVVSKLGGVRIVQSFATGKAAEMVAQKEYVKNKLMKAAGISPRAEQILQDKKTKREFILRKVTKDGRTVHGESLEKLLVENSQRLSGTEGWGQRFDRKPLSALEEELQLEADQHLDTLFARAKKL